jgi:hypothetical protein
MIQALQSTLRVIQTERTRTAQEASRVGQAGVTTAGGKKSERDSASPTEMRSPKARRRKSKAM